MREEAESGAAARHDSHVVSDQKFDDWEDAVAMRTERAARKRLSDVLATLDFTDVVHVVRRCGACGDISDVVFRIDGSPSWGAVIAPPFHTMDGVWRSLERLLSDPYFLMSDEMWEAERGCDCGAPTSSVRELSATLIRPLVGTGTAACLMLDRVRSPESRRFLFLLPRTGLLTLVPEPSPEALHEAVRRPLTLYSAWRGVVDRSHDADFVHVNPEPGVHCFAAATLEILQTHIAHHFRRDEIAVVSLDAVTVREHWPASFADFAHRIETGDCCGALLVETNVVSRALNAVSWPFFGTEVVQSQLRYAEVLGEHGIRWPLEIPPLLRAMAAHGRTLLEAALHGLQAVADEMDAARNTLAAIHRTRPHVQFRFDGTNATPLSDAGVELRTFDLRILSRIAQPDDVSFQRDVKYFCDPIEPWVDPTRTCPCGAPASVQRALFSSSYVAAFEANGGEPFLVLDTSDEDGENSATTVVTLACDRHARTLAASEFAKLGITQDNVEGRIEADLERSRFRLSVTRVQDQSGARGLFVEGNLCARLLLHDEWLRGLNEASAHYLRDGDWHAAAFGPDGLCLAEATLSPQIRQKLVIRGRVAGQVGPLQWFTKSRILPSAGESKGSFELIDRILESE